MRIALILTILMTLASPTLAAFPGVDAGVMTQSTDMREAGPRPHCGPLGCMDR